ncbi:MAG: PD-(D/E)XK nuclease family protein [Gemmatimonadales bacterium]
MNTLLAGLAAFDKEHPVERKLLLGPDLSYGREMLLALARHAGGWLGWESATLRSIAEEVAFVPLAVAGRRPADDVDIASLLDRALDVCLAEGNLHPAFAEHGAKLGIRAAVRDAVLALRVAGATPEMVRRVTDRDSPAGQLPVVMERFAALLDAAGLVDPAGLFETALSSFDAEAPFVLDGVIVVPPGLKPRGLAGLLLERLGDRKHVLAEGATNGPLFAESVTPALFHAASPADEVREVLRRVLAEPDLAWDQVEIVTTDPDTYGVVLHGLALRDEIPLTSLKGVPMARTRTGRAVARVLEWLENGLPADLIREAMECGELGAAGAVGEGAPDGASLSRALRRLRVGWGRKRYDEALQRLTDGSYVATRSERHEDEDDESLAQRGAAAEAEAKALAAVLGRLLAIVPTEVPELGGHTEPRTTPAVLAKAALEYLDMVPVAGGGESRARERHLKRLRRLAEVEGQPQQPFATALAAFRESLADLRAWPLAAGAGSPWVSAGGQLYVTDLEHAGTTGRSHVFVVGLDADHVAGSRLQDPILTDADRSRLNALLGHDGLATTADRAAERRAAIRLALGAFTGPVTVSYATASSPESGAAGPSWVMLEALRCDPAFGHAGYDDLRRQLGEPASPVPQGGLALDGRDVWLGELAAGSLLLDGREAVRAAHPDLARGLEALKALEGDSLTAHHGLLTEAAGRFDPTLSGRPISPSSLQALAACPLRWFYKYGLGLRPPDDVEYDPECWLDPMDRGSLLHRVFERFVREFRTRQGEVTGEAADRRLEEITSDEIRRWKTDVPPPGEAVFQAEGKEIHEIARGFLNLERERAARVAAAWLDAEYRFGKDPKVVELRLPDGSRLPLQGSVDRVDRLADGTLRIIDYKTGGAWGYVRTRKDAPLKGGRVLQAALYAHAAATLLGAKVSTSEYWFPATDQTVPYGPADLSDAPALIASLLEHPRAGTFIPTTESGDCTYCDYAPICRVTHDRFYKATSRLAEWAKGHAESLAEYGGLLARNEPRDGGDEK